MNSIYELSVEVSEHYDFNKNALSKIEQNTWVKNQWPIVYFIQNPIKKVAYVGESTNALSRIKNHLANPKKAMLKTISIIGSDKFNKSATLDIESKLIQYISSEETYQLLNGNFGLINHNYYQQDLYGDLFKVIWERLIEKKIVSKSLEEIENSELFKYSPYKSLNEDQYNSVIEILDALSANDTNTIFVHGSAGTGKTILATYLIKLLASNLEIEYAGNEVLSESEIKEITLLQSIKKNFPDIKVGLVIAMTSLRETLKSVFRKVPGLKSSMVIGPSDTFKKEYDLLIVDEAHRLRQYKNIGWMGAFKKRNRELGLGDEGTELDWIIANSKSQIFFYDEAQSVKPSDVASSKFGNLLENSETKRITLASQMRVKGGNNYISFVDKLLNIKLEKDHIYNDANYELLFFDFLPDLYEKLSQKEKELGLCRLIAGYSWEWLSDNDSNAIDIKIDGLEFQWNRTPKDWINSPNAFKEIGCIHTTQGYDLNYTGLIFGKEIDYDPIRKKIVINRNNYFDKYGNQGANEEELHNYIINIYKTIMYRGIRGTFIYACNKNLGEYLKRHISTFEKGFHPRIIPSEKVKKYVNAVPLYDIKIAAGNFSELQISEETKWIELPSNIMAREGYFVCQIIGNSMDKRIPDGSWCLFKEYDGGSRNGEIVLAEHHSFNDSNFGAGYTIKKYESKKVANDESEWQHESIVLKPLSDDPSFEDLILSEDNLEEFKIIGIFIRVLDESV